jgi:cell division protein FtsL
MLRFVNICLVLGLVAIAYVIYQVKYEARGLDGEINSLGKRIEEERDSIAVLRAEWSLLNRPERIERLARKYLKLAPAKPLQLLTLDTVSDRDFDRTRVEIAAPVPAAKAPKSATKLPATLANVQAAETSPSASAPWPEAKIVRPIEASAQ